MRRTQVLPKDGVSIKGTIAFVSRPVSHCLRRGWVTSQRATNNVLERESTFIKQIVAPISSDVIACSRPLTGRTNDFNISKKLRYLSLSAQQTNPYHVKKQGDAKTSKKCAFLLQMCKFAPYVQTCWERCSFNRPIAVNTMRIFHALRRDARTVNQGRSLVLLHPKETQPHQCITSVREDVFPQTVHAQSSDRLSWALLMLDAPQQSFLYSLGADFAYGYSFVRLNSSTTSNPHTHRNRCVYSDIGCSIVRSKAAQLHWCCTHHNDNLDTRQVRVLLMDTLSSDRRQLTDIDASHTWEKMCMLAGSADLGYAAIISKANDPYRNIAL